MSKDIKLETDGDVKDLAEVFEILGTKVPSLLKNVLGTLYSPEAGKNMGQSIGSFYNELTEAGIPKEDALEMAKNYMLSLKDIGKMTSDK